MTVLWGIVIDVSLMAVRYLKTTHNYTKIHGMMMLVINISTIVMALLMVFARSTIIFYNFDALSAATKLHFILGLTLLVSVVIQHIGGFIMKYLQ
jgi:hypothetical protein